MIPYARQFAFEPGQVQTVSPLVQRLIAANPGPFTYTGTGTYVVGRPDPDASVAVIDPGPMDEAHLQALLAAIGPRQVSHILVTHRHRDHAPLTRPLAQALDATGTAPLVLAMAATHRPNHVSAPLDEEEDPNFEPDQALSDGQIIGGDGWTLEALFTPGHTSDHVAFALREENALFSGDHIMGWSTSVVAPPDGDMTDYMASLDRVIERNFTTLWPTHGPPVTQVGPFLQAYRQHRLEREAQVLAQLDDGPATIADMVPVLYAAVDRRLWPAASLSLQAHLIKLVKEGRVSVDGEADLAATYSRAQG